ncbi:MAG TPA: alpha/beta fold hydrolase [Acetobacteraceae bacterium]|nr:alpha/beta fold hydrolase [Acetobacteraceae bacterium]
MILHAIEAGPPVAGGLPPVVLLHGLFGSAGNLGRLQRRLAARFRVLALDLRNHGASPHARAMDYPTMAADVFETLASREIGPVALVGHSMGGKVAMAMALLRPEAIVRLAVADIAPVRYPPHHRDIAAAMRAIALTPGLTRAAADAALAAAVPQAALRAFLLQNLHPGATPSWRIDLDAIAAALPQIEDWPALGSAHSAPRYDRPVLFIAGEHSDYLRPEYRAPIRALFPTARLATLKAAGHWLHADNPEGFAAVLEEFLSG